MTDYEQRYQSESVWRQPRSFFADYARDLHAAPELAWQLSMRNLRARYRQSLTGYLWAFIPPLGWAALFLMLRSAGQIGGAGDANYVPHLIVGLVFWQVFIESAQTLLRTFAEARPMLGKIRFPREALLLTALIEVGFQFLVRTPLLVVAWFLAPGATMGGWWLLPVSILGLMVCGFCVGIVLLPLSLLYDDVAPALGLAGGFWLLITPIAYTIPADGPAATLARWNPAAVLVSTARAWWLGISGSAPIAFVMVTVIAAAVAILAWTVARVAFPHLIARFGS